MIRETISINDVLELLNDLVITDRRVVENLIEARFGCNEHLAKHDTIQVLEVPENECDDYSDRYMVGILGILNGLFGISETGFGVISAMYDVNCPSGCKGPENEEEASEWYVGSNCFRCGDRLVLGDLLSFERTPDKYLYDK